jgi:leucyl aminopeptidase
VRLRVLIPAVENSVAGNAIRPGDVLASRKGISIEIGNTDAEGRLVLADALALADEETPDLLIDLATLTGAGRVALGPDINPFFTGDEKLAADLARHAVEQADPLWRLPLWAPYRKMIDSPIADINNAGESPHAGAITAALFLKDFVGQAKSWVHLDIFAWNAADRHGRPKGGEATGMRALFALIQERYG